jgi:uncharacterized protein (UPF0332 family)
MIDTASIFLAKAEESLSGAESEFANGRYNNCANRSYYACFQAAISALIGAGIHPSGGDQAGWAHTFVQARFSDLVNRRKLYPPALRDVLSRALMLRQTADYETDPVTRTQAQRTLDRARAFVAAVRQ